MSSERKKRVLLIAAIALCVALVVTGTAIALTSSGNTDDGTPGMPSSAVYENQMTIKDVYALARKGDALTLKDFEPFTYMLTGENFAVRRYDVVSADVVFVTVAPDGSIQSAELQSRRTLDRSMTVDLLDGFEAVAGYLDPLKGFSNITIERPTVDTFGSAGDTLRVQELFFEDNYFGSQSRYYLNAYRFHDVYVVFESGERMKIIESLEQQRVTMEELAAHGLGNVNMVPIDNPLGGRFTVLHHWHRFTLNDEPFYPSKSFMYVVRGEDFLSVYFDIDELIQILEWYGYDDEAVKLRAAIDPSDITTIASGNYVLDTILAKAGCITDVGWSVSSHTPVWFYLDI